MYASAALNAMARAQTLCFLAFAPDGRIVRCNEGARRALGLKALTEPQTVWELLSEGSVRSLREMVAQGPGRPPERQMLNFAAQGTPAVSFSCDVTKVGDSWVVCGERRPDHDAKIQQELLDLTHELSTTSRERAKLAAQLASALADLKKYHWNIRRPQEFLPVCAVCRKVRQVAATGETQWTALTTFLLENGLLMSHSYCPECEAAANAEIDAFLAG